ncbi:MAG: hypothetical protein IKZ19_03035 [Clostridia bacterium]|nr:hypothetical protein [Clostridia bacterium]
MGYREYAKDYEIEYRQIPGKKRQKAVRIYVGPYFRLDVEKEKLGKLKLFFLLGTLSLAMFLLVPMGIDCAFTRTWYIQVPAVCAWIPWIFAAMAVWTLWRSGKRFDREHKDHIYSRLGGATVFLLIFCGLSSVGSVVGFFLKDPSEKDLVAALCCGLTTVLSGLLFWGRRQIRFAEVENPEKPQAKKKADTENA